MTTTRKHFARELEFDVLLAGLEQARSEQAIYARAHDTLPDLLIWNYTNRCVYDKMWSPFSMAARGLILDMKRREVVATPFPKFFNVGENSESQTLPDQPFEVFEKLDGSLIILFYHDGQWRASTRGAFGTDQAIWADAFLAGRDLSLLETGATYLCEAIYAENRIVIEYEDEGLVLLSGYDELGFEFEADYIEWLAQELGWRAAKRYRFESVDELLANARDLPETEEGYVLRFADGQRLKLKGGAYCRVHALINRITPLAIWEMLLGEDDLDAARRLIPEEFWSDFDSIEGILRSQADERVARVLEHAKQMAGWSDKEVGLALPDLPPDVRKLIFLARKAGDALMDDPKARTIILRDIRPTLNQLEGYTPSFALARTIGSGD